MTYNSIFSNPNLILSEIVIKLENEEENHEKRCEELVFFLTHIFHFPLKNNAVNHRRK